MRVFIYSEEIPTLLFRTANKNFMESFKRILIFEPEALGHQSDYIRLLISYLPEQNLVLKLTFLVSSKLIERLSVTEEMPQMIEQGEIEFITLTERETAKCTYKILWIRSLYRWLMALKYCKRCNANHIHYLHIDHMQFPLALRLPVPKRITISGILFRPSIHYSQFWNISLSLREKISSSRKKILYRFMLTHPGLKMIFSLDKYFASYAKKTLPNGHKIRYLPDPSMFPADGKQCVLPRGLANLIPPGRKIFLLFGALDKRKGIFEVIQALSMLDTRTAKKTALIFAGKLRDEVKEDFIAELQKYLESHPASVWIHLEDRFLSEDELVHLMRQCDVALIPYQRHIGSSGLLIWAASVKKPVITQNFGLMGVLTREYKLGQAIDTTKPSEIAKAIKIFVDQGKQERIADSEKMATFVNRRSPEEFSRIFFEEIIQVVQPG